MWSDPIADMLTRIRNAVNVRREQVKIPASNLKVGVAEVLKQEGYIRDYDRIADDRQGILRVQLKYTPTGVPAISKLQRVSTPGLRRYCKADGLPRVLNGLGIAIVSTSQGVMSDRACREKKIGGEVLCTVT